MQEVDKIMFPWFSSCADEDHDWIFFGVWQQCRKCLKVSYDIMVECPTCEGSGVVYTNKQVMGVAMNPLSFWFDTPLPRECPRCSGKGRIKKVENKDLPRV